VLLEGIGRVNLVITGWERKYLKRNPIESVLKRRRPFPNKD
jgi:hypothetical protein